MEISPSGVGWTSKRQGNGPCMARDNRRAFATAVPDGERKPSRGPRPLPCPSHAMRCAAWSFNRL